MYDLVVMGASNEVMSTGWATALAKRLRVLNLSIGGCGVSGGIYRWLAHPADIAPPRNSVCAVL